MASRSTRGRLGASSGARGICRPGTTRAQVLRQAKSAALIDARREPPPGPPMAHISRRVRTGLPRVGPPPLEPKRLDFSKPGMTKSMLARMQHTQKLKEAEELKKCQEEAAASRRPRRTAPPLAGDSRLGRERVPRQWQTQSVLQESELRTPTRKTMQEDFQVPPKGRGKRCPGGPGGVSGSSRLGGPSSAKRRLSMGTELRTTVTEAANRSIQVLQETLDEQDVAECVVVQNKLQDLQNARRDLVMAIANVSGNAVNFADDLNSSIPLPGSPLSYQTGPLPSETPQRYLQRIPDNDDPYLQFDMDRHQATLANTRQFLERREAAQAHREAQRRIDEEFARAAAQLEDDFRYDVPFEQDLMEGDISFEEDEDGTLFPCQSRIKASMPPIPQRDHSYYNYRSQDVEELEKFFDTANYPVVASSYRERRHPGREIIHPDLQDMEDPWYRECSPERDLIEFDLMEFSP